MSGAHTPAPWHVGGGTGLLNQLRIEPAIGCAYGSGEEVLANAMRMAAANELLAALEAMLQEFGRHYLAGSSDAVDAARTAVIKAKGAMT